MQDLQGKEKVIDAYCGIGTIGMIASDKAKEVIGVELNKDAVRDARINARENKVVNISFRQGMPENLWKRWQRQMRRRMWYLWIRPVREAVKIPEFRNPPGTQKNRLYFLQSGNTGKRSSFPYKEKIT